MLDEKTLKALVASVHEIGERFNALSELIASAISGVEDLAETTTVTLNDAVRAEEKPVKNSVAGKTSLPLKTENKIAPGKSAKVATRKEKEQSEKIPAVEDNFTKSDLKSLSYNNLKKLAVSMGINAVGSREELIDKILSAKNGDDEPVNEEPDEVTSKNARGNPVKSGKSTVSTEESDDEEDEDEDEDAEIIANVKNATENMSDEEIASFLTNAGIRAKGKRASLIAALVKGVKDGIISFADDDEDSDNDDSSDASDEDIDEDSDDESDEDTEDDTDDSDDDDENSVDPADILASDDNVYADKSLSELRKIAKERGIKYSPKTTDKELMLQLIQWDYENGETDEKEKEVEVKDAEVVFDDTQGINPLNDTEETEMTPERAAAIDDFVTESNDAFYTNSELTRKEMIKYLLSTGFTDKDSVKSLTDEQVFNLYINVNCYFIDDTGASVDLEEPYEVNGENYCCGKPLKLVDGTYICETCGNAYNEE